MDAKPFLSGEPTLSAQIRSQLGHPVIDSDGHMIEFEPDVLDVLNSVGGKDVATKFTDGLSKSRWYRWHELTSNERHAGRVLRSPWWGIPASNTLDRATATIPGLLYERLDEFGIDFAIAFPSLGAAAMRPNEAEVRQAACRAFNTYYSELYSPFSDRITPVAVIPMHTPEEAITELEHVVNHLGLKAVTMPSYIRRPIAKAIQEAPNSSRWAYWLDTYGLDSEYDYDPVWSRCRDLGVSPAFHSTSVGSGHDSISNYAHNHIGTFATAGQATCKSLFMGGVTRRFPELRFAFLEGGVGWACSLFGSIIEHWEKRNVHTVENYNPQHIDRELLFDLYKTYGGPMADKLERLGKGPLVASAGLGVIDDPQEDGGQRDEWKAIDIEREEDIVDLFIPSFYFGCEADDRSNVWAFNTKVNPFGARLNTLFGSDIGHWDVPDMSAVLGHAYHFVETELINDKDFKDFVFENPVRFYAANNPDFFRETILASEADTVLSDQ